jgi:hypothetical protein
MKRPREEMTPQEVMIDDLEFDLKIEIATVKNLKRENAALSARVEQQALLIASLQSDMKRRIKRRDDEIKTLRSHARTTMLRLPAKLETWML